MYLIFFCATFCKKIDKQYARLINDLMMIYQQSLFIADHVIPLPIYFL